jgi:hypothetical protein
MPKRVSAAESNLEGRLPRVLIPHGGGDGRGFRVPPADGTRLFLHPTVGYSFTGDEEADALHRGEVGPTTVCDHEVRVHRGIDALVGVGTFPQPFEKTIGRKTAGRKCGGSFS